MSIFQLVTLFTPQATSIRAGTEEMKFIFEEYDPFTVIHTVDGECILLEEQFMDKVQTALNTNSLEQFNEEERQLWYEFVGFEDALSWSADEELSDNLAIGATNQQEDGYGYVVTRNGITDKVAIPPQRGYPKVKVSSAIDKELMRLYNCDTSNVCGILDGEFYDPSTCTK